MQLQIGVSLSDYWPKILGKLSWDTFHIDSPLCLLRIAADLPVGPAEVGAAEQGGLPAIEPPQVPAVWPVSAAEPLLCRLPVADVESCVGAAEPRAEPAAVAPAAAAEPWPQQFVAAAKQAASREVLPLLDLVWLCTVLSL